MGLEKTARTVSARFFEPHVFYQQEMLELGKLGKTREYYPIWQKWGLTGRKISFF